MASNGFKLTRAMGWMLITEYTLYVTLKVLQVARVLGPVRVPRLPFKKT